ncbi:tetratricopeptide repeat-containing response regulator [Chitinolyticbacter albus]|uniref:tetratricopeptide repeat-containing response regulator n=1 Tax=Chitinolyticbacter albus TaxID=2961951 RepID=UPI00210E4F83|nr:tetratricopeptide repeat-containing response regulator [Chitinolyticbacter albus]
MAESLTQASVLVADDAQTVRQSVRLTLGQIGITRVDLASSVGETRRRLKNAEYDVVLCDYHFGEGMNGQELLEELRRTGELPLTTVWFMITAEASYEKVVAVAEVGPDDYLIKPFSGARLSDRLLLAWDKKQMLRPLYEKIGYGDTAGAIAMAQELLNTTSAQAYQADLQRLLSTLLLEDGQLDAARKVFEEILQKRVVPWAKLGLARVHNRQSRKDEAEAILKSAISDHGQYVDAYEELAALYMADGRLEEAMSIYEQCLSIAPNNISRLQKAGNLASMLGQPAKARALLERAVTQGGNSSALAPETVLQLALAAKRDGAHADADRYLRMLNELAKRKESFAAEVVGTLAASLYSGKVSDLDALETLGKDAEFTLELAVSAIMTADFICPPSSASEQANPAAAPYRWLQPLGERFITSKYISGLLEGAAGQRHAWAAYLQKLGSDIAEINKQGVQLMLAERHAEAVERLVQLAQRTHNHRLMLSAAHAIVRYLKTGSVPTRERNQLLGVGNDFLARLYGTIEAGVLYNLQQDLDHFASTR